jgi:hypothetical protein
MDESREEISTRQFKTKLKQEYQYSFCTLFFCKREWWILQTTTFLQVKCNICNRW